MIYDMKSNKLCIIKSSGANAIDSRVATLAVADRSGTVPAAERLTHAPGRRVASALAELAVPGSVRRAGQASTVDHVQPAVADTHAIHCHLVRSAGNSHNSVGALRPVEDCVGGAALADSSDEVVASQADAGGSIEVGLVAAGRS